MVQIQLKQKGKNRKLRIAKVRTKWESNILVADLFLTSGYVSAWKHTASAAKDAADATEDAAKAAEDYLSPLDDLNKFTAEDTTSKASSGNSGSSGGGVDPGQMFEDVPIESNIEKIFQKIKDLIKSGDFEGLGEMMADAINRGLKKVKKAISWDNVGPTVTYFVTAFTRTFNSLVDNIDSYTVQASTITKTQKEMTDLKYKLEHGLYVKKEKITLMEWYETWLEEYKKNRVKIGTYTSYEKYYKSTINNRLGNKELSEIRGEHIQKLYNDMVKEGYAISSIKIVSAILNGCLQQAMKNGLIERNPVKLAELPRQTGTKKERTAMTKEQQDLFMKYAEESYLYHFFSVMLRTGMRKGEMQGLKYSDIDKKQNVIHVRRTLKYIEEKGYFEDTPKTRTSTRDIPLTAAITEHIEAQRKYWGFKVVRMDQYLFCNENGDPISRERIQGEIDRIIKRIKSDGYDFPRITSHVFRHTFATRAIEAGMPPQVLKTILGHSSLAMTMDLYSHVLPDTKADEMQKIANVF